MVLVTAVYSHRFDTKAKTFYANNVNEVVVYNAVIPLFNTFPDCMKRLIANIFKRKQEISSILRRNS